ncbi:M20/M25/M40 family metallo-hydrolase [Ruminococcus sp. FC2018]|uniref:M20/M25/M40 family metallo-hydrolase n=1 Tax=Ruminococcus sp. FC2018 TaxID=1410617 RepID=UPI00048FA1A2|nr:M20/M25/M40 family metallo-hydrolase [Ruminococcus sp. FC2018]
MGFDLKQALSELCAAPGVSGAEKTAQQTAQQLLSQFAKTETDSFGNVYGYVGEQTHGRQKLMLEAHIDEIGYIVTYITDEGFLKISGCGGIDERALAAQQVTVYGKETIKGVITSIPPHLSEKNNSYSINDVFVDIGLSKQQAEKLVSPGDRVLVENELVSLGGSLVTSKALDDRSGVAAVLLALDMLKDKQTVYDICVLFAAQEETGERGAKTGAFRLAPDLAIAVDVSFAKTHFESEEDCAKMGQGAMIGIAPVLSSEFSQGLIQTAERCGLPYQLEIMSGTTGTDADKISITAGGVRTVIVSVPLKYMHTPVEVIDLGDVEKTAQLIAEFAQGR